jgi:hypothetical protein
MKIYHATRGDLEEYARSGAAVRIGRTRDPRDVDGDGTMYVCWEYCTETVQARLSDQSPNALEIVHCGVNRPGYVFVIV